MGFVQYETEGAIGIITIDRPKALNALNSDVLSDLDSVIDGVDTDVIRALIDIQRPMISLSRLREK